MGKYLSVGVKQSSSVSLKFPWKWIFIYVIIYNFEREREINGSLEMIAAGARYRQE